LGGIGTSQGETLEVHFGGARQGRRGLPFNLQDEKMFGGVEKKRNAVELKNKTIAQKEVALDTGRKLRGK